MPTLEIPNDRIASIGPGRNDVCQSGSECICLNFIWGAGFVFWILVGRGLLDGTRVGLGRSQVNLDSRCGWVGLGLVWGRFGIGGWAGLGRLKFLGSVWRHFRVGLPRRSGVISEIWKTLYSLRKAEGETNTFKANIRVSRFAPKGVCGNTAFLKA